MITLKNKSWRFFKTSWPILLIIILPAVFFWKFFLLGHIPIPGDFVVGVYYPWLDYKWGFETGVPVKNPITTDVVSFTFPMQTLAVDLLKEGKLPLWNPYILGGTPLLANFQSAPFSPTNFLYFITDKLSAWSLQVILQHFLAALFTYLLLRHWKLSKLASLFGGIIFAFSGFNLIWSQWNGHALAASFIPLSLLFCDRLLTKSKKLLDGIAISITTFLMFLSGYPQLALYLFSSVAILWLIRITSIQRKLFATLVLILFILLGVSLSAFQILPGFELLSLSQREVESHPFEWAFLPWEKVITFVAPDYYGNHATKNYWGPQDYTSNTGFVGVIAIIFSFLALNLLKKKVEVKFGLAVLIFSLIMAFPTPLSIFLWKSGILGLNAASAHRSLILFNLSVSLLAGFGIDYFLTNKTKVIKALLAPGAILLGFGLYATGIPKYVVALRNLVFPSLVFVLTSSILYYFNNKTTKLKRLAIIGILPVVIFELFRFGWKFTPFSPRNLVFPRTPVLDFLINQDKPFRVTGSKVIPINLRMPYHLESQEGYDAVYSLRTSEFVAAINGNFGSQNSTRRYANIDNETSPLMDLVNNKYNIVLKKDLAKYDTSRFDLAFEDKSVVILENKKALPRAFMVYDWEILDNDNRTLERLLDPGFPIDKRLILEEPVGLSTQRLEVQPKFSVEYQSYKEQESEIQIETEKDGLLFISDSYYPGWKAFVDGIETKILRADFNFRSIIVPEGTHEVRFVYLPESFFNGLKISLISLIILAILGTKLSNVKK